MSEEVFIDAMIQLCHPKYKVLGKQIKKPTFAEDEKINLNLAFKSNSIRVNLTPKKTTKKKTKTLSNEEVKQKAQVEKERTYVV